ncbi:GATA zinc finger domain-containing protein 11-like [Mangifera indica]|uniref:GATA zinc finger domain-containing protein 11-like n=1 Tax=Mangifera indica TaxID=29780 RepID=UPI001CFA81D7|nr:GATA zinc finger domain-containing protein 11-like [Mangifera indica]
MAASGEWMQFYQQNLEGDSIPFSDASLVTTSSSSENILGPGNLCSTTSEPLNPKGCVSKPIRRRSRASKKTPTTLLNANANNFRSLVQQFTGCPSSTSFSFGSKKGPVNLSFGLGNEQNQRYETYGTAVFGNSQFYSDNQQSQQLRRQDQIWQHQQQQQHHHQGQLCQEQQQYLVSLGHHNVNNEGIFSSRVNNNIEIPEGFSLDDIAFNEHGRDAFANQQSDFS